MRATADGHETIVEFEYETVSYRVILPTTKRTFYLDVLVPDSGRPWVGRWSRYALGRHDWQDVLRHERIYAEAPLPEALLGEVRAALQYAALGTAGRCYRA